jgi:hypothetical protein
MSEKRDTPAITLTDPDNIQVTLPDEDEWEGCLEPHDNESDDEDEWENDLALLDKGFDHEDDEDIVKTVDHKDAWEDLPPKRYIKFVYAKMQKTKGDNSEQKSKESKRENKKTSEGAAKPKEPETKHEPIMVGRYDIADREKFGAFKNNWRYPAPWDEHPKREKWCSHLTDERKGYCDSGTCYVLQCELNPNKGIVDLDWNFKWEEGYKGRPFDVAKYLYLYCIEPKEKKKNPKKKNIQ